jgi:hypothetical protein
MRERKIRYAPADDCRGVNDVDCMGVRRPFKSFLLLFVMSSPNALLGPRVCFAGVANAFKKQSVSNMNTGQEHGASYLYRILVIKRTT